MAFPTLQFPLYRLSDEVGSLFAILKNGVHALQSALGEAGRHLLMVDLFASHGCRIDDITNCYKPYFCRYHLLRSSRYLISSNHQNGSTEMAKQLSKTQGRRELRNLLDKFILTSRSQVVRVELSDTIVAAYVNGYINREEYHSAMAEVV